MKEIIFGIYAEVEGVAVSTVTSESPCTVELIMELENRITIGTGVDVHGKSFTKIGDYVKFVEDNQ